MSANPLSQAANKSQTSPMPSPSESSWSWLAISGQLSIEFTIPSPSLSVNTAPVGSLLQDVVRTIHIKMYNDFKKVVFIILGLGMSSKRKLHQKIIYK